MTVVKKYRKEYVVKSYEADCHGFLRVLSLMNFLQDIATENAELLGVGLETCREQNLSWVGSNYLIQIMRMPRVHECIVIETWPAESKLWGAIRDFVMYDKKGDIILKASSQWVLIDYERRRPVMLEKHFPGYTCVNERAIITDFPKMSVQADFKRKTIFNVRFDDIDVNEHVNNAIYPVWASESLDSHFRKQHYPAEIEISFKKEALYGEKVQVLSSLTDKESNHIIQDMNSGTDLAYCRINWRKIT